MSSYYYMCPHTTTYRRKGLEAFTTALLLLYYCFTTDLLLFYYCFITRIGDKGLEAFRVGEGAGGKTVRKLLFSATLTRNPSKLAPLRLREPLYFTSRDRRYQTPKELKEFMVQ